MGGSDVTAAKYMGIYKSFRLLKSKMLYLAWVEEVLKQELESLPSGPYSDS